ncbi:MAG: response regulator [Chitinophagales bacterium]
MKLTVFIVDDEIMYSKMLSHLFKSKEQFNLHVFSNGSDCIDNLHLKPDVILLDYSLPDDNGEVILKRIKEFDKRIFVIVISGSVDKSTPKRMIQLGAHDFISKDLNTKYRILNTVNLMREVLLLRHQKQQLLRRLKK